MAHVEGRGPALRRANSAPQLASTSPSPTPGGTAEDRTPASLRSPEAPVHFFSIKPLPRMGETLRLVPFLSVCSMAGVLTRIGLDVLFGPDVLATTKGQTFPDWYANVWGSFVLGFLVSMRPSPFFAGRSWLYVGLASGYCGCTTTFSSWNQEAATYVASTADVVTFLLMLFGGVIYPLVCFIIGRHLHSFLLLLLTFLTTAADKQLLKERVMRKLAAINEDDIDRREDPEDRRSELVRGRREIPAVVAGEYSRYEVMKARDIEARRSQAHLGGRTAGRTPVSGQARSAQFQRPSEPEAGQVRGARVSRNRAREARRKEAKEASKPYWRVTRTDILLCSVFTSTLGLLYLVWILLIVYAGQSNRYIWISCLFAPFGALIRYVLSRYNTWRRCVRFPLFTLLVNAVGSIGLAFTAASVNLKDYSLSSSVPGYTLRGFEVGFFGSLTTVSTFIAELYALPPVPYLYVYAIVTVGITQAALIPINGLFMWP